MKLMNPKGTDPRSRRWFGVPAPVAAVLTAVLTVGIVLFAIEARREAATSSPAGNDDTLPAGVLAGAGLPPLPSGRLVRSREVVEDAYLFAAQHPEVLKYLPCFCGCDRQGHRSNLDCFVASAPSEPVHWNPHGMG